MDPGFVCCVCPGPHKEEKAIKEHLASSRPFVDVVVQDDVNIFCFLVCFYIGPPSRSKFPSSPSFLYRFHSSFFFFYELLLHSCSCPLLYKNKKFHFHGHVLFLECESGSIMFTAGTDVFHHHQRGGPSCRQKGLPLSILKGMATFHVPSGTTSCNNVGEKISSGDCFSTIKSCIVGDC